MFWFYIFAVFFSVVSVAEFGASIGYKNITCSNNITVLDIFFNSTDFLNENNSKLSISPNLWLLINGIVGFVIVITIMFIVINKNKGNNKNFILSFITIIIAIFQILLFVYAIMFYSSSSKICSDIENINFKHILYVYYGIIVIEVMFVFAFIEMKAKTKPKETHTVIVDNNLTHHTNDNMELELL